MYNDPKKFPEMQTDRYDAGEIILDFIITPTGKFKYTVNSTMTRWSKIFNNMIIYVAAAEHPDEAYIVTLTKNNYTFREYFIPSDASDWDLNYYLVHSSKIHEYVKFIFSILDGELYVSLDYVYESLYPKQAIKSTRLIAQTKQVLMLDRLTAAMLSATILSEKRI